MMSAEWREAQKSKKCLMTRWNHLKWRIFFLRDWAVFCTCDKCYSPRRK